MTIYGYDISKYQAGIDLGTDKHGEFVLVKMTEGRHTKNPAYEAQRDMARRLGLFFGAYHWLHSDSTAEEQVANVLDSLGGAKDIPISLDVERSAAGSARWSDVLRFKQALLAHGLKFGLLYLPGWYWSEIGRPHLDGWDLWQSNYGPNDGHYPGDDSSRWGYPGTSYKAKVLQFTSSARIPGWNGNLDKNAYRGTREELAATGWFKDYSKKVTPVPTPTPAEHPNAVTRARDDISNGLALVRRGLNRLKDVSDNRVRVLNMRQTVNEGAKVIRKGLNDGPPR